MKTLRPLHFFLVVVLTLAVWSVTAGAGQNNYHQKIDRFFQIIKAGKSVDAVKFIYSDNQWMSKSSDAVQQVIDRMASLDKLVGQFRNYELLQEKVVGNRYAYVSYLAAYDRQPLRFVFEYYRPEDEWRIFSFSFDDKLDDDIDAAAKMSLLSK
jgi:hypothetical protein